VQGERARARVALASRALWRIRLSRSLAGYLVCACALAGLLASARFALAPPRASAPTAPVRESSAGEAAERAFAVLFARRYLAWSAAEPQRSASTLEAFAGDGLEGDAGVQLPPRGEQRVEWAEAVQSREAAPGERVVTVAAQTSAGLVYLAVPVTRAAGGALALAGYPAFVGSPAAGPARAPEHLREVSDPALATVVERALRNYLASSAGELDADLAPDARVSLPAAPLTLVSMQRLEWAQQGSAVLATVQAQDARGVRYTLAYELEVVRAQGRWEISAVETDPDD